jgi:cephalosporin hydroxylase
MTTDDGVTRAFHNCYYESNVWRNTYWHSTPVLKCPFDLWIYQEIVASVRPALIVECGTWAGGSALFLAHMLDIVGKGTIITIDLLEADEVRAHYSRYMPGLASNLRIRPEHPRIKQLIGSSIDQTVVAEVFASVPAHGAVMVIADSDHSIEHAYAELRAYHSLITSRSYFIMEDTNIPESGPRQAVDRFLAYHPEFHVDAAQEKFLLSFNPGGYLRRK